MSNHSLAIFGGPQVVTSPLPHFPWPLITPEVENAVRNQLYESISIYDRSGVIEKFEKEFSDYHNIKYGLLTSSGTAAIHSMYAAAGVGMGDEIICPAYTFFATVTPLFNLGAIPVLCDADETGNINTSLIESLITAKTKGVVMTHMWGIPCKMDRISSLCRKHKLLLFEDASHAHGAKYQNKLVPQFHVVNSLISLTLLFHFLSNSQSFLQE